MKKLLVILLVLPLFTMAQPAPQTGTFNSTSNVKTKLYTAIGIDTIVARLTRAYKAYTDASAANTLSAAKTDATNKANAAQTAATTNATNAAKIYTDVQVSATASAGKAYTDNLIVTTATAAKVYTDNKTDWMQRYVDSLVAAKYIQMETRALFIADSTSKAQKSQQPYLIPGNNINFVKSDTGVIINAIK